MPIYDRRLIKYYAHNYLCLSAAIRASERYPGMPVCIKITSREEVLEANDFIDNCMIRPRRVYMDNGTVRLMLDYETKPPKVYRLMGPSSNETAEEIM